MYYYSSKDRERAREILGLNERKDLSLWIPDSGRQGGKRWKISTSKFKFFSFFVFEISTDAQQRRQIGYHHFYGLLKFLTWIFNKTSDDVLEIEERKKQEQQPSWRNTNEAKAEL